MLSPDANSDILTLKIVRPDNTVPWGFKLQGGSEFSLPLLVQSVSPISVSHKCGLQAGDEVIEINNKGVQNATHQHAKSEIMQADRELDLKVIRTRNFMTGSPTNAPKQKVYPTEQEAHQRGIKVGMVPFESSPVYNRFYSQKFPRHPQNVPADANRPGPTMGTGVFHKQYNSPIGLYSDQNVLEAVKAQTGDLLDNAKEVSFPSEEEPVIPPSEKMEPYMTSESKISRSFRALEADLHRVEGTSNRPMSIFDLKRKQESQQKRENPRM